MQSQHSGSPSQPKSIHTDKDIVLNDKASLTNILNYLGHEDHVLLAGTNRMTRAFIESQKKVYHTKLLNLENSLAPAKLEEEKKQENAPEEKVDLTTITYPTSAHLFKLCTEVKMAPSKLIQHFKSLKNKRDGYGATPLITLGEHGMYRVAGVEKSSIPDYQFLNILVNVCGYDINFKDFYGTTALAWLAKKNYQNNDDKQMIRYCLAHPKLTTESANKAFVCALSNTRAKIEENKDTVSITEFLKSGKIDLTDSHAIQHVAKYRSEDTGEFEKYISLFQRFQPNMSFANVIEKILEGNQDKAYPALMYVLENKLVNLDKVSESERLPISSLIEHAGKNAKAVKSILDLFERYSSKLIYPYDLLNQIAKYQRHQFHETPEKAIARIANLLKIEKLKNKMALTSAKFADLQKDAGTYVLGCYFKAQSLLLSLREEKSEYIGGFSFFGKQFGGVSNKERVIAMTAVVNAIEEYAINQQDIDLDILTGKHPVLLTDNALKRFLSSMRFSGIPTKATDVVNKAIRW